MDARWTQAGAGERQRERRRRSRRTARHRLPFRLTWSFTFPVGTLVVGTSELAIRTGATELVSVAVVRYIFLVGAWATVTARTAHALLVLHRLAPLRGTEAIG
jgi:tellurite resistance protein TehA-like permease